MRTLSLIAILAVALGLFLAGCAANTPSAAPGPSPAAPAPGSPAPASGGEVVKVRFLYASWCEYCQATRPMLDKVAADFGARLKLETVDEARRQSDATAAAMYAGYKERKLFGGFPTLVAEGARGESALVGQRSEEEIRVWLCGQYADKPAACRNTPSAG